MAENELAPIMFPCTYISATAQNKMKYLRKKGLPVISDKMNTRSRYRKNLNSTYYFAMGGLSIGLCRRLLNIFPNNIRHTERNLPRNSVRARASSLLYLRY